MPKKRTPDSEAEPPKRERRTAPVQIEAELARMAGVIASHRRITQSELLSPFVRQFLITEYKKVQADMGRELDELKNQSDG